MKLHFCIFAYNRGRFLANCVRSIELCAPGSSVTIYDDNSDDPATLEVLAELALRYPNSRPLVAGRQSKHGGLYANMQRALDEQAPGSIVCFMQDDMQLVRKLEQAEIDGLNAHFSRTENPSLLQPAFLKGGERSWMQEAFRFDESANGYLCERHERSAGLHYSDICIASVDQLRALDWQFKPREKDNEMTARTVLPKLLYVRNPFLAWLPSVPAWRGRMRTLGLRLGERLKQCGFHPLRLMSEDECTAFLGRDPAILPIAEDFLVPEHGDIPQPWVYHPLQDSRWLKHLDSTERRIRGLWR
jgi:glycosyltransferase involved in cell wall biosynthesis